MSKVKVLFQRVNGRDEAKRISFKYDAELVSTVKKLSQRKYDACDRVWETTCSFTEIQEVLKDYEVEYTAVFYELQDALDFLDSKEYAENINVEIAEATGYTDIEFFYENGYLLNETVNKFKQYRTIRKAENKDIETFIREYLKSIKDGLDANITCLGSCGFYGYVREFVKKHKDLFNTIASELSLKVMINKGEFAKK